MHHTTLFEFLTIFNFLTKKIVFFYENILKNFHDFYVCDYGKIISTQLLKFPASATRRVHLMRDIPQCCQIGVEELKKKS